VNYDGPCCLAYIFFAQCPLLLTSLAPIHSYRRNLNRGPYSTFPDCYRVRKIARDSTISLRRLTTRLMTSNNVSSLWETIFRLVYCFAESEGLFFLITISRLRSAFFYLLNTFYRFRDWKITSRFVFTITWSGENSSIIFTRSLSLPASPYHSPSSTFSICAYSTCFTHSAYSTHP